IENSVKILLETVNKKSEYEIVSQFLFETIHYIFSQDYKKTKQTMIDLFQPNYDDKVECEIAIGVGKTTFSNVVVNYLCKKSFTVYKPLEASLNFESVEKLNKLTSFDYIIFDRTYIDTEVFTIANINDIDILTYLEEQRQKIFQINNVDKIFYIKSTTKIMFEWQEKRRLENHNFEMVDKNYLLKIYNLYEKIIDKLYPEKIKISTEFHENGTNLFLNIDISDTFFDIKLIDSYDFNYYLNCFLDFDLSPKYYEIFESVQPFDSEKDGNFIYEDEDKKNKIVNDKNHVSLPCLLLLSWDIESSDTQRP
ncbi:14416_t:CDS:2, partial [Dentiscutata heterogama]